MATLGASIALPQLGLTFATGGFGAGLIGLAVLGGAAFVDNRIQQRLLKKGQSDEPRLLSLPYTTNNPGSPRVWAMGRRVRVPVHILFQSEKTVLVGGGGGGKVPSQGVDKVLANVGLLYNDRYTERIAQLAGNGNLLFFTDRNIVSIRTDGMVATSTNIAGQDHLVLTMADSDEVPFTDKFEVDDVVTLAGWIINSGPNINSGYWKVHALTEHASGAPSSITLRPYSSQTLTSLNATAGDVTAPASVTRVDDKLVGDGYTSTVIVVGGQPVGIALESIPDVADIFFDGGEVIVENVTPAPVSGTPVVMRVQVIGQDFIRLVHRTLTNPATALASSGPFTFGSTTNAAVIRPYNPQTFTPGMFAADPALTFYQGGEHQEESSIIALEHTTGSIPGFRGSCYQMLDTWDLSPFGNSVPFCEALIEPDPGMLLPEALLALLAWAGITAEEVDTSHVSPVPFEGFYVRGTATAAQALQPIMLAHNLLSQERDGRMVFFHIETADVVQVENGAAFSDLGAYVGRDTPNQSDKIRHGQLDVQDLPTSVGIRHQDPDNLYASGFQSFGLRSTSTVDHQNVQEVDASTLVLTRKQARNLAATSLRRSWINSHTVEVSLPAAYLHTLENDLLTVTDDDGNDITCRIIRREVGRNFLVNILAVREELDLAVSGSPVQNVSGSPVVTLPAVGDLDAHVLDIAPLIDEDMWTPGVYLAASSRNERWAGAIVYVSFDGGTNYARAGVLQTESMTGLTLTSLDAGTLGETSGSGPTWDNTNEVDVELYGEGPLGLATQSETNVLAGWNWFLIGDEILGVQEVAQTGTNTFTLSKLLRGIRGTYHSAEDDKAAGQAVVGLSFFNLSGLHYKLPGGRNVPATVHFKFVPSGRSLADVPAIEVEVEGWNSRPFPVRDFSCVVGGSPFDATFNIEHWSRRNYPVGYTGPYELDETRERYVLRIYDPTNTTLMRTIPITPPDGSQTTTDATQAIVYTAAQQTTDGYSPAADETFWVEVAQVGDYGEGRTWRQEVP